MRRIGCILYPGPPPIAVSREAAAVLCCGQCGRVMELIAGKWGCAAQHGERLSEGEMVRRIVDAVMVPCPDASARAAKERDITELAVWVLGELTRRQRIEPHARPKGSPRREATLWGD